MLSPAVLLHCEQFDLSTTVVSLIFVTLLIGYLVATILVGRVHMTFGQRCIVMIGPLCHIIPFIDMATHPLYPQDAASFRINNASGPNNGGGNMSMKSIWLLIYMGSMVHVHHGDTYESGLIPTGFWAGVTLRKFVLGFASANCDLRRAHHYSVYLAILIALEHIFGLVAIFIASANAVPLLPFVAGAITGARGVQSLQPLVLALLVALIVVWLLVPRGKD
ncbi:hypothetical protein BDV32DRAFT_138035 [Aspergillus pseudonomiae]|nr:hypothetical protein BDV32DRAFT_138035 [Aspergillus pseudonomiae]